MMGTVRVSSTEREIDGGGDNTQRCDDVCAVGKG